METSDAFAAMESALIAGDEPEPDYAVDAEPIPPDGLEQANRMLLRVARADRDEQTIRDVAAAQIAQVERWRDAELGRIESRRSWATNALRSFHAAVIAADPTRKTISLPAGTLKARKAGERIEYTDTDAFLAWARKHCPDAIRTKYEPDKTKAKQLLRVPDYTDSADGRASVVDPSTGQVVPGVVGIPAGLSWTAKPNTGEEADQ